MGEYTQFRADYVPSTKHHGPYITTQFGSTMCDFYVMSQPHLPSTAAGGPSKPIHFLGEEADGNAARFVACLNAIFGVKDPEMFMDDLRELLSDLSTYFDNKSDLQDGDYGTQEPNAELRHYAAIEALLKRIGG